MTPSSVSQFCRGIGVTSNNAGFWLVGLGFLMFFFFFGEGEMFFGFVFMASAVYEVIRGLGSEGS